LQEGLAAEAAATSEMAPKQKSQRNHLLLHSFPAHRAHGKNIIKTHPPPPGGQTTMT